jgi:putative hydrolase of the HAD superfamily
VTRVDTVVCDYGGVLTNPIAETFAAFSAATGITLAQIGTAMMKVAEQDGDLPMARLERGEISEAEFLRKVHAAGTWEREQSERLMQFSEIWFAGRVPNQPFIAHLRALRARGYTLALLTNNVREWEPRWRATVPADELFAVVVNSAHEGTRKPERAIYERLLARLGRPAEACLFVDDVEENCAAAAALGMPVVRFESTDQAVRAIEARLAQPRARRANV